MRRWQWIGELAAAAAVIVSIAAVGSFWTSQAPATGQPDSTPVAFDFMQFYALGYATSHPVERIALESDDAWNALLNRLVGEGTRYHRLYGPHVGVVFAPFTALSLFHAYLVWNLLSLTAFGLC